MGPQARVHSKQVAAMNQKLSKANKYGAVRTTVDGIEFASKAEARHYSRLKLRERAGEITNLQLQRRFDLIVHGEKVGVYIADFVYEEPEKIETGTLQVIDVKGVATPLFKFKAKVFEALYGVPITLVK